MGGHGLLPPLYPPLRISVCCCVIRKDIFENFHIRGHRPQESEIENRSNRHLTQSRLQVTGCTAERYCLLQVYSPRVWEFQKSVNFSLRCTVAELYGASKLPNFRILAYFPHTNPLNVPSGDQPTAQGLHLLPTVRATILLLLNFISNSSANSSQTAAFHSQYEIKAVLYLISI